MSSNLRSFVVCLAVSGAGGYSRRVSLNTAVAKPHTPRNTQYARVIVIRHAPSSQQLSRNEIEWGVVFWFVCQPPAHGHAKMLTRRGRLDATRLLDGPAAQYLSSTISSCSGTRSGPSECDDVIRRAHVSRSRGLPHREGTDGLRRPPF